MISILIPVYNTKIYTLVSDLSNQILNDQIPAEIIVLEDGSDKNYLLENSSVASIPFVKYIICDQNLGRIITRKKLAEAASYDWLLFIDADSKIISNHFLKIYNHQLSSGADVILGGRIYEAERPQQQYLLHWKYGSEREKNYSGNNKPGKWRGFLTNNFLIKKNVFKQFSFIEGLNGYGHEDTLMGVALEKMNCKIQYINNPVLHLVLHNTDAFISNAKNALLNLKKISIQFPHGILKRHVKLFRYYSLLRSWYLLNLFRLTVSPFKNSMERNLRGTYPSLFLFDVYRLICFIEIDRKV